MLKMVATGTMRILKKLDGGEDKNGQAWAHFAAISCEETVEEIQKNDFYVLKAFGSIAEYIERNLNMPRRATVSGELVLDKYLKDIVIERDVEIEGESYAIQFSSQIESTTAHIYVHMCSFLDKKREKEETSPKEETITVTKN